MSVISRNAIKLFGANTFGPIHMQSDPPRLSVSIPCAIRSPKTLFAAYSLSIWIGCQSPVIMAKFTMSDSVIVRDGLTIRSPTV